MGNESSRTVTVANMSRGTIYAKVDKERTYLTELATGVKATAAGQGFGVSENAKVDWRKVGPGFVEIRRCNYIKFDIRADRNDQVYVSIVTEKGKVVADNLQKIAPCGLILDRCGFLEDAPKGHIWTPVDPSACPFSSCN